MWRSCFSPCPVWPRSWSFPLCHLSWRVHLETTKQNKKKFSNKLTLLPRTGADNETITKLWYFCSKRNSEANLNSIYLLGFQATVQCTSQNIFLINSPPTSKLVTSLLTYLSHYFQVIYLSASTPFHLHTYPRLPSLPYTSPSSYLHPSNGYQSSVSNRTYQPKFILPTLPASRATVLHLTYRPRTSLPGYLPTCLTN